MELLHEIILVDDASSGDDHDHLGSNLEEYVARLSVTVKIVRSSHRFVQSFVYDDVCSVFCSVRLKPVSSSF